MNDEIFQGQHAQILDAFLEKLNVFHVIIVEI